MGVQRLSEYGLYLLLRQSGVEKVVIDMRAHTCVDTTMRYAAELGHHVILVKDAILAFTMDEAKATVEINAPSYDSEILSSAELIARIAGSIQKGEKQVIANADKRAYSVGNRTRS